MCVLSHNYLYPNLSEGADRVAGQLRGDKECPFSGVTKYGRVWRKVPESDARRVSRLVKRNLSRRYSQDATVKTCLHQSTSQNVLREVSVTCLNLTADWLVSLAAVTRSWATRLFTVRSHNLQTFVSRFGLAVRR